MGQYWELSAVSRTKPITIDGLRVAVAGLPNEMSVEVGWNVKLGVATVGDLRLLTELPYRLEVAIPYRLEDESVVTINRCAEAWD